MVKVLDTYYIVKFFFECPIVECKLLVTNTMFLNTIPNILNCLLHIPDINVNLNFPYNQLQCLINLIKGIDNIIFLWF
jgi:hypothetical protein